ncbi:MAG: serine hydrolase domain-containing protein [Pikeienuella sp.]
MNRWLKYAIRSIGVVLVIVGITAVIFWDRLERLYQVNTLFSEEKIVTNFSDMRSMFEATDIHRAGPIFNFKKAPQPLPETFQAEIGSEKVTDFLTRTRTTSLLVIRDDKITYEEYFLDTKPSDLRVSWSIAKSYLSTLVGIALHDGAIENLDDPVVKYAPLLKGSAYETATIRNVATMSSGVKFNEDYLDYDSDINRMGRALALGSSLDQFAADLKETVAEPGRNWRYVSIDTHVLGMVLRGATGQPVADYMRDKLWNRIGVEADAYYITDSHDAAFVLGGLNVRTRDYAKLGRLFLRDGEWEGEQVVPAEWVRESTASVAPPVAENNGGFGYGYQWWQPPRADDEFFGIGVYGQYLWVDRKAGVIIVKTSANRNFRENSSRPKRDSIALFRAISRP